MLGCSLQPWLPLQAVTSQPVPPSYVPDALSLCEGLQDSIVAALRDAAAQKGTVAAMPIPGTTSTVRKDLEDLKTESEAFQQALLAGVDVSLPHLWFEASSDI